jgi:hypothetical protein
MPTDPNHADMMSVMTGSSKPSPVGWVASLAVAAVLSNHAVFAISLWIASAAQQGGASSRFPFEASLLLAGCLALLTICRIERIAARRRSLLGTVATCGIALALSPLMALVALKLGLPATGVMFATSTVAATLNFTIQATVVTTYVSALERPRLVKWLLFQLFIALLAGSAASHLLTRLIAFVPGQPLAIPAVAVGALGIGVCIMAIAATRSLSHFSGPQLSSFRAVSGRNTPLAMMHELRHSRPALACFILISLFATSLPWNVTIAAATIRSNPSVLLGASAGQFGMAFPIGMLAAWYLLLDSPVAKATWTIPFVMVVAAVLPIWGSADLGWILQFTSMFVTDFAVMVAFVLLLKSLHGLRYQWSLVAMAMLLPNLGRWLFSKAQGFSGAVDVHHVTLWLLVVEALAAGIAVAYSFKHRDAVEIDAGRSSEV